MPRQDVPYGGAICRLKERIAEIRDELGKKLHSINGVEGDAAGDVKIVSGDAAVVVTSDQVNHQITVGLDQSELPSAAVTSVNGRTGDVILHSSDIGADGGVSVQGAIDNLSTRVTANASNIGAETLARQNADNALQTNINNVQASIPAAAATAVSNDPTVAQLATDVPNKIDKITSGSSLKAYTHTGATQGETSVVDGTAANSIGIRDANGRMQAADPASGATDKTLVTANWVSQSGDSGPNNLLHKQGNETKAGTLSLSSYESLKFTAIAGNAPAMVGNTTASQRILDQYISYLDNGEWMIRNTIFQSAHTKNYSRILYLRRLNDNNQIMQTLFSFTIDANGKGHITVTDNDGTNHQVI